MPALLEVIALDIGGKPVGYRYTFASVPVLLQASIWSVRDWIYELWSHAFAFTHILTINAGADSPLDVLLFDVNRCYEHGQINGCA